MLTNLMLEITVWERPLWGLGLIKRPYSWSFTPAEYMTDEDVYEWAQRFRKTGADVNIIEMESVCVSAS